MPLNKALYSLRMGCPLQVPLWRGQDRGTDRLAARSPEGVGSKVPGEQEPPRTAGSLRTEEPVQKNPVETLAQET